VDVDSFPQEQGYVCHKCSAKRLARSSAQGPPPPPVPQAMDTWGDEETQEDTLAEQVDEMGATESGAAHRRDVELFQIQVPTDSQAKILEGSDESLEENLTELANETGSMEAVAAREEQIDLQGDEGSQQEVAS
jgi:hypothetical protein